MHYRDFYALIIKTLIKQPQLLKPSPPVTVAEFLLTIFCANWNSENKFTGWKNGNFEKSKIF